MPSSKRASGAIRRGIGPAYVYGIAVGDEREGRPAASEHLERWIEAPAPLRHEPSQLPGELEVSRSRAVLPPAATLDAADRLGVDADAGREPEAAPVHAPDRDPSRRRSRQLLGCCDGVAREAERAREHVRAAAGDEAHRCVGPDPVQHLVEPAVARVDVHGFRISMLADELGRVPAMLRAPHLDVAERGCHLARSLLR